MKRKMIIMDLDGTLLRNDKTISEYTKMIIDECHRMGSIVVFATARPERTTLTYIKMLNPNAVVSNNGAKINCIDDEIRLFEMNSDNIKKLISSLIKKKLFICLDYEEYSLTNCPDYQKWINWNAFYTPDFAKYDVIGMQKISVRAANLELFSDINFKSYGCNFYANHSDSWYMITSSDASKARAVEIIASHYGISMEDTIAFGDDQNDIEMLQTCGTGVAMENGISELKLMASCICPSNENDGVAKWIEKNLLKIS
ncbi:MAG: HAD family hydrolase [Bacilli bacterium]|nr:HAD family hydrolase [Bacilli bacterium]